MSWSPDEVLSHRLWRVRRTVLEMCRDRGYYMGPDDDPGLPLEGFKARFGKHPTEGSPPRSALGTTLGLKDDPDTKLSIFFPDEPKVGVKPIREYIEMMRGQGVQRAIIVVQTSVTPSARKAIAESLSGVFTMECFEEADLVVNITQHEMVPKHEVLSESEKQTLLQRYKLKDQELPRIKLSDPVARYYGLSRGQVVKITRPSPTAGRYVTYRLAS
eukprot:m.35927 g.35927  ORF g.35927 m.35927 type:complete len:216 (+) comp10967_c0_seq1:435-1082(+)